MRDDGESSSKTKKYNIHLFIVIVHTNSTQTANENSKDFPVKIE